MSYILKLEEKTTYLHATVTGENTKENVMRYLFEVMGACLQHDYKKVLIIENLAGPGLGVFNMFEITGEVSTEAVRAGLQIAYVDVNIEHDMNALRFSETAARNRGINVRIFSDVREAERWLTESSDAHHIGLE